MTTAKKPNTVLISRPDIRTAAFSIIGTAPYVQNKFTNKAKLILIEKHEGGGKGTKSNKAARDFDQEFKDAQHISTEGWVGIPAAAFRSAMVSACRLVGFKMTQAKLAVFILADGFDADEGTPLVRMTGGEPVPVDHVVRIQQTINVVRRPQWPPGWTATVRVQYDAGMFTESDVANLIHRVGIQVGIGEGRPDSKSSTGMGWGTFIINDGES